MNQSKIRILFFGEDVTLAHVARPCVLANALDQSRYEVHFACSDTAAWLIDGTRFRHWPISTIGSSQFLKALETGKPPYSYNDLAAYVRDDVQLIEKVHPSLVVGDFRLSLAVSAAISGVPYIALANAHWSPYAAIENYPVPDLPIVRKLGLRATGLLFRLVCPFVFAQQARGLNRLRRDYGLPALGDLRHVYTHGDLTLYLDVPQIVPCGDLPSTHRYLGPVIWSPDAPLPEWWSSIRDDVPCVYITMGSSGPVNLLPVVLQAISNLPVCALVATARRSTLENLPNNVFHADYLPGSLAARRSQLVICNGGSATVYQALAEGVPVLGLPANMDQYLTMQAVEQFGAGVAERSGLATVTSLRERVASVLRDESVSLRAQEASAAFKRYNASRRFPEVVAEVLRKTKKAWPSIDGRETS